MLVRFNLKELFHWKTSTYIVFGNLSSTNGRSGRTQRSQEFTIDRPARTREINVQRIILHSPTAYHYSLYIITTEIDFSEKNKSNRRAIVAAAPDLCHRDKGCLCAVKRYIGCLVLPGTFLSFRSSRIRSIVVISRFY